MKLNDIYKCSVCGNIIELVHVGGGELVCCKKPMEKLEPGSVDAAQEKHVPVIEKKGDMIEVTIGSVLHPMQEEHYIEWIELIADSKIYRKYLKPGDEPKAVFNISGVNVTAREYCNLHGFWEK